MSSTAPDLDTAAAVLDAVRESRAVADREEARLLMLAVDWAAMHSTDSIEDAACDWYGDQPIPVAGHGAPLVAEFSITEFAIALGLPTETGKTYVGEALELRHRLPRVWARVVAGDLPAWRARRIARSTIALTREAAGYVDGKVAHFAHKIRPTALDRTITAAIARFMPDEAAARQRAAADGRRFDIDTRGHLLNGLSGTAEVHGTLDLADALDLETAIADVAGQLKDLGSTETLDARRAAAIGQIARRQLALDLTGADESGVLDRLDRRTSTSVGTSASVVEEVAQRPSRNPRTVILHVHLAHAAITSTGTGGIGTLDNLHLPVLAQQVRDWCGTAGQVTVKPVIDLNRCAGVDHYDIPQTIAEQVDLRDRHCVFPWCSRPARRCDTDHVLPHGTDGITCTCNLAPLCRRHHRLKTHSRWRYQTLKPGMFLWTSPYGYQYLVDHDGTADVSAGRRTRTGHPPDPP